MTKHHPEPAKDSSPRVDDPTDRSDFSMVEVPIGSDDDNHCRHAEVLQYEGNRSNQRWIRLGLGLFLLGAILAVCVAVPLVVLNKKNTQDNQRVPTATTIGENTTISQQCAREVKMCTDMTTVTRTGPDCAFEACPEGACMVEERHCEGGWIVGRDPNNQCDFKLCPGEVEGQDQALEEGECPEGINPRESKMCPDLSIVTRSGPDCAFAPCPP